MNFKSDINNPIEYILGYCNISNLDTEFYKYISPYSEMSDYFQLDRDKWTIQQFIPEEERLVTVNLKESFRKHLILTLNTEFRHSQNLIEEYKIDCGDNNVRFNSYIKIKVEDKLNSLVNENLTSNYPYIVKFLENFIDTLNTKYTIVPIELKSATINESELSLESLIDEVFSFLYSTKSPRTTTTFINQTEFQQFKTAIISFLNGEEYAIDTKINIDGIANNELTYLIYIVKSANRLRPKLTAKDWFEFVLNTLANYNESHRETFTAKMKSKIVLAEHPYLPPFVKSYYLKNMR